MIAAARRWSRRPPERPRNRGRKRRHRPGPGRAQPTPAALASRPTPPATRGRGLSRCGDQPSAHREDGVGATPPALPRAGLRRAAVGVRRGRAASPRQIPIVRTMGRLAMTPNGCYSQPPCLLVCRPSVSLHRPELRRRPLGSSPAPVLSLVSFPRSNLCPAPDVRPCRRSRPDQPRDRCASSGEAGCGSVMVTGRRFWRLLVPQAP